MEIEEYERDIINTMEKISELFDDRRRILVTGGAGFIGGALIRKLITESNSIIFNIDKMGYSSDLTSINQVINKLDNKYDERYKFYQVDILDKNLVTNIFEEIKPDLVIHLAAESHVDRSIDNPNIFLESNITGTLNMLNSSLVHFNKLTGTKKNNFRFHHVSTDEVYGSLGEKGFFSESSKYEPNSPYSASKAASDHLVNAWYHTYGLPIVITNCSNNYGPWQFPEKLIPLVITKALSNENIPLYGNGLNIRDWLYVYDHVDALLLAAAKGSVGNSYCIGGKNERTNYEVIETICAYLDKKNPTDKSYFDLVKKVEDRPGPDKRYAIDPSKIMNELQWKPKVDFKEGISRTIDWYIDNINWTNKVMSFSNYNGERLGLN